MKKLVLLAALFIVLCACATQGLIEMTQAGYDYLCDDIKRLEEYNAGEKQRIMNLPEKERTHQDTLFIEGLKDGTNIIFLKYYQKAHAKIVKE